jgi:ABC-2 type transport system permease protein
MFTRILTHEWRALRADSTIWVIAVVFAAAIGYGVWNGARWVGFQQITLSNAAAEERDRYDRLRERVDAVNRTGEQVSPFADPRSPSNVGSRFGPRYAAMPPGPLAALAIGQSDLLPYYFRVSTDARENIMSATELENPHRLLTGRFDLAFVLIYLYPLLILGITYNLLSAEKEEGTLALALSQPVSLRTLITGKVALRALLLIGIVTACSLVALLVSGGVTGVDGVGGAGGAGGAGVMRAVLWLGVVMAYGAIWFAIAIVVASFGRASATNATILASVWLVLVVMLPSLFNLLVTTVYPVPSRVEMVQAVREASDEANAAGSKVLARYYEDHPELATGDSAQAMTDFALVRVAVNDDVAKRVRPVIERFDAQVRHQQVAIDRLKFLSPAILLQDALNDISGTGAARHRFFLTQVDRFHQQWRAFFTPLIFQKASFTTFERVPRFTFQEEPTGAVVSRVLWSLFGLALPAAILIILGLRRLHRFSIVSQG